MWIKIEDQKPEEGQKVFYYFEYTGVNRGKYSRVDISEGCGEGAFADCFYGEKGFLGDDVTHWMPDDGGDLPQQPK